MHYLLHTDSIGDGRNFCHYRSEELDSLIDKPVFELDRDQPLEYVRQIAHHHGEGLRSPRHHYKRPYGATTKMKDTALASRGCILFKDAYLEE
jgi:hypothetical protein